MMTSFSRLIRHEWTIYLRNGVMRVVVAAFVLLSAATLTIGAAGIERARSDSQLLTNAMSRAYENRAADDLGNQHGSFAILPAGPLQALSVGQADVYASHFRITARSADAQLAGDQLEHPLVLHAGRLDLSFVVLFLYSLLIIGLSYDLVASERDNGTLRLVLVQGGTLREFILGKVSARLIVVLLVPIVAALTAYLVTDSSGVVRLTWWMGAAIAYGIFWLGISVYVNARGGTAVANALTLVGVWLMLVIISPSLVNLAVRVLFPVPSRVQLDVAMRAASRAAVAQGSRTLGRFLEDHPSAGTGEEGMTLFYTLQDTRDRQIAASIRPLVLMFESQRERQARAISTLQYASPTILAQMLLSDVAGTSGRRAQRFAEQAARFQEAWRAHFAPVVFGGTSPVPQPPAFQYIEEPVSDVVRRSALPLLILTAVGVGLMVCGMRRFTSYDISGAA
jgi:ABC-2 type transport system permease protein